MSKLYIMRGIPASGKSTKAREIVSKDPEHTVRYNWDDLRNMMGDYWVEKREKTPFLKDNRLMFLNFWMTAQWNIVIDNTNLNPKDIAMYESIVNKYNKEHENQYEIEFVDCFTPVEECIRRDKLRAHPIGEKVIKDFWRRYRNEILHIINTKFSKQFVGKVDENKSTVIVADLDSTVALNLSKRPYFGAGCAEGIPADLPINPTIDILRKFDGKVIFVTGRDESCRKATSDWIDSYINLPDYQLVMRAVSDYRSGVDVKLEEINKIAKEYNILYILEDTDKIVNALRDNNYFVLQPTHN